MNINFNSFFNILIVVLFSFIFTHSFNTYLYFLNLNQKEKNLLIENTNHSDIFLPFKKYFETVSKKNKEKIIVNKKISKNKSEKKVGKINIEKNFELNGIFFNNNIKIAFLTNLKTKEKLQRKEKELLTKKFLLKEINEKTIIITDIDSKNDYLINFIKNKVKYKKVEKNIKKKSQNKYKEIEKNIKKIKKEPISFNQLEFNSIVNNLENFKNIGVKLINNNNYKELLITYIPKNHIFYKLGLKNKDKIIEINEEKIINVKQIMDFYSKIKKMPYISLKVKRGNEVIIQDINIE